MKNILIIGGSYGIGLELAKELQTENNVFIASRTNENLSGLVITHIPFDATTDILDTPILPAVIDGLIYCPGSINLRPFRGLKLETFESDMHINFFSMVKVIQNLLPQLTASEQASIVLFSSVAVKMGMPFHTSVSASKGAIEGLTKALSAELAPTIRVNCIAPSLTNTPLAASLLNSEQKVDANAQRHPLKRVGSVNDISEMACFLLSEKASWITGQIMHVDGGMSSIKI